LNVIGLRRGGFTPEDRKEIKRAYSLVLRSKSNREEALKEAEGQGFGPLATRLIKAVRSPSSRGVLTR
ncbi:MAG: acyl-ACP--UDP-N-acetylglucosamine O-acyltransferase, partial [Akkermansiaceae bacterium]